MAIPYQVNVGALEYRRDLLRKYGYDRPPKTWNELERMAKRIQAGERAEGKKDFWGYVWQGMAGEALTHWALQLLDQKKAISTALETILARISSLAPDAARL